VGFITAHAATRSRHLYILADSSIVIHSGHKGGTISGAQENLKQRWVSLWINRSDAPTAAVTRGNSHPARLLPSLIAIHRKFQTRRVAEDSTLLYGEATQHRMRLSVDGYIVIAWQWAQLYAPLWVLCVFVFIFIRKPRIKRGFV